MHSYEIGTEGAAGSRKLCGAGLYLLLSRKCFLVMLTGDAVFATTLAMDCPTGSGVTPCRSADGQALSVSRKVSHGGAA